MALTLPRNSNHSNNGLEGQLADRGTCPEQPSHLAHDARNWLTVLRVYCDLLRNSGAIADGYEAWMEELSGAVERGQKLMDSLLDSAVAAEREVSSREDASANVDLGAKRHCPAFPSPGSEPGSEPGPESVELVSALSRRLPVLRHMAGAKVRVDFLPPTQEETVRLPESDFDRILYNLAGNAIDAMPRGGNLCIEICPGLRGGALLSINGGRMESGGETVRLLVSDTGTGIEPDRLPAIFEIGVSRKRRWDSHPERRGFGLAIVRELTERAGGAVRVHSEPGRGSCFEVELLKL